MTPEASGETARPVPFYEQVANILRTQITSEDAATPIRLPTERDLCVIHHVSRITISKALDLLESEGLIQRTPGRGTLTIPAAIHQWKRLRQSQVIHVLKGWENLEAIPSSFYGQIYQGILSWADQAGYRPAIKTIYGHRTQVARDPYMPNPETTLGIIFLGLMNEPTIQLYAQAGYPVVCTDFWSTDPRVDAVVVDCYSEGQIAVDFLVRQGHREMFYMGNHLGHPDPGEKETDSILLMAGIQRGLDMAGLPMLPPERIRFVNNTGSETNEAVDWYLSLRPRPTAGIIFNIGICDRVIQCLKERGVRCPEDISLVSKTISEVPNHVAGLRAEAKLIGELAVDALLDRVSGRRRTALRLAVPSRMERGRTVRPLEPKAAR